MLSICFVVESVQVNCKITKNSHYYQDNFRTVLWPGKQARILQRLKH